MFFLYLLFGKVISTNDRPEYCNNWIAEESKCNEWVYDTGPILEDNVDKGKRALCPDLSCNCSLDASKCICNDVHNVYGLQGKVVDKDGNPTGDCMRCTSGCSTCIENPNICEDCSYHRGKVLDENNQFTGICLYCTGKCESCQSDYTKCDDPCDDGYGKVLDSNGDTGKCARCTDNHCFDCSSDHKKCEFCAFGYTHYNDKNEDIFSCIPCLVSNCNNCDKSGPNFCDICRDGYGPEIISNKKTGRCIPCLNNCYECPDGIDKCIDKRKSVKSNKSVILDKENKKIIDQSIEDCSDSSFISGFCSKCVVGYGFEININNERTGKCKICGENCTNCRNNADVCTKCKDGYGFEYDENGKRKNSCKPCQTGCSSCMPHYTECNMCKDGFGLELDENGKSKGICKPCAVKNCLYCHLDYTKCVLCLENYGFVKNDPNKDGQCERCSTEGCVDCSNDYTFCDQCLEDGFTNGIPKGTCAQCPLHCSECYDPDKCYKCIDGYGLLRDENGIITGECRKCQANCKECLYESQCIECNEGYGIDSKGQCHKCPDGCYCDGNNVKCDGCLEGYYQSENKCLKCKDTCKTCLDSQRCSSCDDGYTLDGTVCKTSIDHCISYLNGNCNYCEEKYKLENGYCFPCPIGYKRCDNYIDCLEGYGPSFINNEIDNFECKICPKNCKNCKYNSQNCFICKDGYYFNKNRECVPYGCVVSNCVKCIDGSLDECEQCSSPYQLNDKRQCSLPIPTVSSPTPIPIRVTIDYDNQLDANGVLQIDYGQYDGLSSSQQLYIELDENYDISTIKISKKNQNSLYELPAKFTEMTIESETKANVDIICNSETMNLQIDSNSYTSIRKAKGSITITNAKQDQKEVSINVIQPLTPTITLIPKTQVSINEVDLNGHKTLIVQNGGNSKVEVKKLKVQQASVGEVESVKITETIVFGLSSYLKVNENVDFSQATLDFSFEESDSKEKAPLNGVIKGKPQKILINEREKNKYLDDKKILLVESSEDFGCEEWGKLIESKVNGQDFTSFECKKENNLYRLYAKNKESKGNKLSAGAIAGIVIAVVVVVGVVVFLLVYFLVIKKRNNNESDNEEGSDGNDMENGADAV